MRSSLLSPAKLGEDQTAERLELQSGLNPAKVSSRLQAAVKKTSARAIDRQDCDWPTRPA